MSVIARIERLAYGGSSVGTIISGGEESIGKKIFINGVIPGEEVEGEITEDKGRFCQGSLLKIISHSPFRVSPPCSYFGACGGCDLQHINPDTQRSLKRDMVESTLRVQGKLNPQQGVFLEGRDLPPFHYRRRVALHINDIGEIGFYRPNSGEVVPIKECLLATSKINEVIAKLLPLGRTLAPLVGGIVIEESNHKVHILLSLREGKLSNDIPDPLLSDMKSLGIELSLSSSREGQLPTCDGDEALAVGHFSQVNEAGNAVLQTLVKSCFTSGEDILDLYAGAGNFSFPLAEMGCKVRAVEVDPVLVKNGKQIAAGLALSGSIEFFESSCERYVTREKIPPAVLLDPPRAGAKGVVVNLDPKRTRKIVYVSCNLPSLSRDLGILVEKGYVLERVSVVDMFSQTHHVETVSILRADTTS